MFMFMREVICDNDVWKVIKSVITVSQGNSGTQVKER